MQYTASGDTTLRIATLNLLNYLAPPNAYYQFDNIYDQQQWQAKQRWLDGHIRLLNADIIGFQEVFSPSELKAQCARLGYPYFACLSQPIIESDYVYSHPPVALASRLPIVERRCVGAGRISATPPGFGFSRVPLHCTIVTPKLGLLDVIVVHLKSKRAMLEVNQDQPTLLVEQAREMGRWMSTMQRGSEAQVLTHYVQNMQSQFARACVVMGDFNQDLAQPELACLTRSGLLADSYLLQRTLDGTRPATHYYGETGNIIDYILVSQACVPDSALRQAQVEMVSVYDQHLVSPDFSHDQFASDHASVCMTLSID